MPTLTCLISRRRVFAHAVASLPARVASSLFIRQFGERTRLCTFIPACSSDDDSTPTTAASAIMLDFAAFNWDNLLATPVYAAVCHAASTRWEG